MTFSIGLLCFIGAAVLVNTYGIMYLLRNLEARVRVNQEILMTLIDNLLKSITTIKEDKKE